METRLIHTHVSSVNAINMLKGVTTTKPWTQIQPLGTLLVGECVWTASITPQEDIVKHVPRISIEKMAKVCRL